MTSRGIRNNNPGNIRHSSTKWKGQAETQTDPAFVQFTDPYWGIRAIGRILRTYWGRGDETVLRAINRWAPPTENDTGAYVAAVAKAAGVGANDVIELAPHAADIVEAIIRHENGSQPYDGDLIQSAVEDALA